MAELIAATTDADQSADIVLADGAVATVVVLGDMRPGEAAIIEIDDGDSGYIRVSPFEAHSLTYFHRVQQILGPGTYRVNKGPTANACSVYQQ